MRGEHRDGGKTKYYIVTPHRRGVGVYLLLECVFVYKCARSSECVMCGRREMPLIFGGKTRKLHSLFLPPAPLSAE